MCGWCALLTSGLLLWILLPGSAPQAQAQPQAQPQPQPSPSGDAPQPAAVPPQLQCLARYYGVRPELVQEGPAPRWYARLPDGRRLVFDDQRVKTPAQRLDDADLEDMFAQRYPTGPIRPVTTVDEDPGRTRVDALFQARYGATPRSIPVVPFVLFGVRLRVHQKVEPAFVGVRRRLEALVAARPELRAYLLNLGGSLVFRNIAGTSRRSAHSYGVSLDINVKRSHYWRWQRPRQPLVWKNQIPQALVDAFEAEGFIWGGRWYHYDTMHFEYRPELLDPGCYPRPAGPQEGR